MTGWEKFETLTDEEQEIASRNYLMTLSKEELIDIILSKEEDLPF